MRWGVTGTPGTGKTTVADQLTVDRPIVQLSNVLPDPSFRLGMDHERESIIADMDALAAWLDDQPTDIILESHLAHLLPVDNVVVLRCHPSRLADRLSARTGERAESDPSIDENVDSERLDLILSEAVLRHGEDSVWEIDTTDREPAAVAADVSAAIVGDIEPRAGIVSFLEDR